MVVGGKRLSPECRSLPILFQLRLAEMTILGILKLAGGCLLPPQPPEKGESRAGTPQTRFGGSCTPPSGQMHPPWLSFGSPCVLPASPP